LAEAISCRSCSLRPEKVILLRPEVGCGGRQIEGERRANRKQENATGLPTTRQIVGSLRATRKLFLAGSRLRGNPY
jgi:hypothetical protein